MRPLRICALSLILLPVIHGGSGAEGAMSQYSGMYSYSAQASDKKAIESSIDHATAKLGFLQRGVARKRLADSTVPFGHFQVFFDDASAMLRVDKHEYHLTYAAAAVSATGLNGGTVQVSAHLSGHTLYVSLHGSKGSRHLAFQFQSGGMVDLETTIESHYFSQPIKYSLHYHR